jgi:hypothetical protein
MALFSLGAFEESFEDAMKAAEVSVLIPCGLPTVERITVSPQLPEGILQGVEGAACTRWPMRPYDTSSLQALQGLGRDAQAKVALDKAHAVEAKVLLLLRSIITV